jgi:ubiquitin-protein ligase
MLNDPKKEYVLNQEANKSWIENSKEYFEIAKKLANKYAADN